MVNSVYTLDGPPRFNYQKPVFKTWTPPTKEDEKAHNITIVPDTEDELVEPSVEVTPVENDSQPGPSLLQAGEATPINVTRRKRRVPIDATCDSVSISTLGSNVIDLSHETGDTDDENLTKLFFPDNFKPMKKLKNTPTIAESSVGKGKGKEKGKGKKMSNPYGKNAFLWSDDDDFVL